MRSPWLIAAVVCVASACAGTGGGTAPAGSSSEPTAAPPLSAPPEIPSAAPVVSAAAATPPATPASSTAGAGGEACGPLDCRLFKDPAEAVARVLSAPPRVLAIGETHAQKGSEGVTSATRRFTDQMLPALAPKASDLVIELWVADPRCSKEKVAKVQKQQQAVTKSQAASDQNEFVTLAEKAKALGVQPHILRPTCEEYDRILAAGPDAVDQMLTMIGRLTADKVKALVAQRDPAKMVITYGGALHNDVAPLPGREGWSFGPELVGATGGKYLELDIIVREFIKDSDSWKALPWYPHFDREKHKDKVVLYHPLDSSFTLLFPAGG